jgi:transcriptional regulator GlxA family with amidase domain
LRFIKAQRRGAKDVFPMDSAIPRRVAFFVFPGFDILDLAGTVSVFAHAASARSGAYLRQVISASGGQVVTSSGISIATEAGDNTPVDTLVVLGGALNVIRQPPPEVLDAMVNLAEMARRVASTCTGAFLLGHAGLLDGRRATTHWRFATELQAKFPATRVEADRIFVNDGPVWTSAGGTAGIDLALALVEEDLGTDVSRQVARGLVVYHRRLGGQSQYSALLELEPPSDRIRRALSFAREHLREPLSVGRLAQQANLSERQFGRAFRAETGVTPARAVERLRAEAARPLVEEGRQSLEAIAHSVGFSDPEQKRQAFIRAFGQAPQAIRRVSRSTPPRPDKGQVPRWS